MPQHTSAATSISAPASRTVYSSLLGVVSPAMAPDSAPPLNEGCDSSSLLGPHISYPTYYRSLKFAPSVADPNCHRAGWLVASREGLGERDVQSSTITSC
uniref:Uncharacterized protein n=1 Tax=Zea mays TaxID=4577 RepID=A0A804MGR3_MAIZE